MIANITTGDSITGIARYALLEDKGYFLDSNLSIRDSHNPNEFIVKMSAYLNLRPEQKDRIFHMSISMDKNDKVDDNLFRDIAKEYLTKLKFISDDPNKSSAPYFVVRHTDNKQPHIHIIGSRVKTDSKIVDIHNSGRIAQTISRDLEKRYGFRVVPSQNAYGKKVAGKKEQEMGNRLEKKYVGYTTPRKHLIKNIEAAMQSIGGGKPTFALFLERLNQSKVDININASKNFDRINGVSFSFIRNEEKIIFKGSSLGKKFSWNGISSLVDYKSDRDIDLLKSIVAKSIINRVKALPKEEKTKNLNSFKSILTNYSKNTNSTAFNTNYRLSKIELTDKQHKHLSKLNKEWADGNYKNNPIAYMESIWKTHRYKTHLANIKHHKSLTPEELADAQEESIVLKQHLNHLLKDEMSEKGLSYDSQFKNKLNALHLTHSDNKELIVLINQWHKKPKNADTSPMQYFFERFSVHKQHYHNQLEKGLISLDKTFGTKSEDRLNELLALAETTNYNSKVPMALVAYKNTLRAGEKKDIVVFVESYISNNKGSGEINNGHQINHQKVSVDLNELLEGLGNGINQGNSEEYKEEPSKKKRKRKPKID